MTIPVPPLLPQTKMYLVDARFPLAEHHDLYRQLYQFWREIWHSTFLELEGKGLEYSDDFLRQDEICVLTAQDKIVGSFSFHWFDLTLESHLHHSYFKTYPDKVKENLKDLGLQKVMTMGQIAVDPKWRKAQFGPFVSEILLGAACKRLLQSDADAIITYTRNNRGMNDLCYRHGARCLLGQQREHNVEVDYVTILRRDAKATDRPGIPAELEKLWRNRTESISPGRYLYSKPLSKAA